LPDVSLLIMDVLSRGPADDVKSMSRTPLMTGRYHFGFFRRGRTGMARAMIATIQLASFLHAVPDDSATAMRTRWCQCLDRALKTIEGVSMAVHNHVEGLGILVAAGLTSCHMASSF
jgi:hypothetical protein